MRILFSIITPPAPLGPFGTWGETLLDNGFHPIPLKGKVPLVPRWQIRVGRAQIRKWCLLHSYANIGILTGEVIAIDIDIDDATIAAEVREICFAILGLTDFIRVGRSPRCALFYRTETPIPKLAVAGVIDTVPVRVEILGIGHQVAVAGTHPITNAPYNWPLDNICSAALTELPLVTPARLRRLHAALRGFFGVPVMSAPANNNHRATSKAAKANATSTVGGVDVGGVPGNRNIWLFGRALTLVQSCTTQPQLLTRLSAVNQSMTAPLSHEEIKSVVTSVWKYKMGGRLFQPGKQQIVLPYGKVMAIQLADPKFRVANSLFQMLKATRRTKTFSIPQKPTAKTMRCSSDTVKRAIGQLIQLGLLRRVGQGPRKGKRAGAILYQFVP
jgi:hypothetical protein